MSQDLPTSLSAFSPTTAATMEMDALLLRAMYAGSAFMLYLLVG
jgi:hypothetical protein